MSGLIPMSSATNPLAANYQPGRELTSAEMQQRQAAGAIPMSSATNMQAANYQTYTAPKQDVLGSSTSSGGSGGSTLSLREQMEKGLRPWDDNLLNTGAQADMNSISDAYAPLMAALDAYSNTLNEGYGRDTSNINDQYVTGGKKVDAESAQLNTDVETDQRKYNNTLASAYQEAIRAYNALAQQGNARFGGASSAGQAMGELANQEFFRQQGNINTQQTEGDLQFAQEKEKVRTFISTKRDELDNWKKQALSSLKSNLDTALAGIQQQKGVAEANKTKDRLAILQSAQATADQIYMADIQFKQDLISNAVNSLQTNLGRALTRQEIETIASEYQNALIGSSSQLASRSVQNTALRSTPKTEDELAGLSV